jgi:hypothetical protein
MNYYYTWIRHQTTFHDEYIDDRFDVLLLKIALVILFWAAIHARRAINHPSDIFYYHSKRFGNYLRALDSECVNYVGHIV